jgi:two-component system chemotaxis response regulator CheV
MIDDQYDFLDDDEIDLVELVSADTNSSNQYLIFVGSDDEVYGINVSKVRELLVYKDLHKVANNKPNSLIRATADIRGTMTAIVNFDEWFENKVLDDDQYELIILAGFGGYIFGIMIKSVEYIVNINPANMQDNTANDSKTNFITKIKLNGQDRLCTIFDGDKMLLDIFDDTNTKAKVEHLQAFNALDRSKYVLFADDSKFVRKLVQSLFDKLELKSKIYEDGALLLEGLKQMEPEEIGLIITDLEMPVMDGVTLMKTILDMKKYQDINIIVHTNMSNDIMTSNLTKIGAKEIIGKIDMLKLSDGIKKYFK